MTALWDRRLQLSDQVSIKTSDLVWYGISAGVSIGGFALQLFVPSVRESGAAIAFLIIGLSIGLTRLVLKRLAAIDKAIESTPQRLSKDRELSPLASHLWTRAVALHRMRLEGIREGSITVRTRSETFTHLTVMTGEARHTLHAVDHISLDAWYSNPHLMEYLNLQLSMAESRKVTLERLRLVRPEHLSDAATVEKLLDFSARHEAAGARLLLCPEQFGLELDTIFFPYTGCLIVDRDARPACLLGQLGPEGFIENSSLHLRKLERVHVACGDYDRLKDEIERNELDDLVRASLLETIEVQDGRMSNVSSEGGQ